MTYAQSPQSGFRNVTGIWIVRQLFFATRGRRRVRQSNPLNRCAEIVEAFTPNGCGNLGRRTRGVPARIGNHRTTGASNAIEYR
jgi:hypothetical protein